MEKTKKDEAAKVRKTLSDTITAFEANKVFAGKGAGADAKKNRKLQNALTKAYKDALKAVDDGDYTKAKEHADAAVKAVEGAGGIVPVTQVGAHGETATFAYGSDGAKANHIGTRNIAAMVGGLSEKKDKAPPANKEAEIDKRIAAFQAKVDAKKAEKDKTYQTNSSNNQPVVDWVKSRLDAGDSVDFTNMFFLGDGKGKQPHTQTLSPGTEQPIRLRNDGTIEIRRKTTAQSKGKVYEYTRVMGDTEIKSGDTGFKLDDGNLKSVLAKSTKEAAATDKGPEEGSTAKKTASKEPYGPGWVSPQGETWESLDTETQEWLKKRRAEIAESKAQFEKREEWIKEFEKQKPHLEKQDEISYVFSNGYVRLKDGNVIPFDEFLKTQQGEDKEPKDGAGGAVVESEEVSKKDEGPKAKTDKDGYITFSNGKMFGRAKKSLAPQGDPTPWTVEVYRGTERAYVKGKTKKEAVDEALKQWGEVPVLYQGHKGPGVGMLKADAPNRRDGDKDTVVAERRPRASEKHPKSPIKLSDYGELKDAIQNYKQTTNAPQKKKTSAASAEKLMGYRPAKKKSHYTPKTGRGGSEMKAAKK